MFFTILPFRVSFLTKICFKKKIVFVLSCLLWFYLFVRVWLSSLSPPFTYTPAPDLQAITYLHPSCPFSSAVCSIKVPALPTFSPMLLLDLMQAVEQINTIKATCDSPAPSKNVSSSVSLHSSNMNLHKSADSSVSLTVSFWSTFVCVCSRANACGAHVCSLLCRTFKCYMI